MVLNDGDYAKWLLENSKEGKRRGWGKTQEVKITGSVEIFTKEEREAEIKRLLKK
jgi:hypothetical protein